MKLRRQEQLHVQKLKRISNTGIIIWAAYGRSTRSVPIITLLIKKASTIAVEAFFNGR